MTVKIDMASFQCDVESGESIATLSEKYGIGKSTVSRLKTKVRVIPTTDTTEAEVEEPEAWDLSIRIPTDRVDDIFATFTLQEKMNAVATVMQARMDAALEEAA